MRMAAVASHPAIHLSNLQYIGTVWVPPLYEANDVAVAVVQRGL